MKMAFEDEAGASLPFGYFDPLRLSKGIDQEKFDRYRTVELKHGRIAQLAVVGYVVPEIFKFSGNIAPGIPFQSIPNGLAALDAVPNLGWFQIFFLIGAVDYWGFLGDFEFGKLGGKTPEELKKAQTQELNHGRLAMLAILELMRHDYTNFPDTGHLITGLPFLYN
ncbi:unnamed protein product [Chrysoparadoxa australica]